MKTKYSVEESRNSTRDNRPKDGEPRECRRSGCDTVRHSELSMEIHLATEHSLWDLDA